MDSQCERCLRRLAKWVVQRYNGVMIAEPTNAAADDQARRAGLARLLPWFLLAVACLVFGGIVGIFILAGRRDPLITRPAFDQAQSRWKGAGIRDYDVEIVVTGTQPATYRVEVRDGHAISAARNGVPLTQPRTFATWSIDGMFGTIETDVRATEKAAGPPSSTATATSPTLILRGRFEVERGLPESYFRADWRLNQEVSWRISRFEPIAGGTSETTSSAVEE